MSAEPSCGRSIWYAITVGQVKRWHTKGHIIRTQDIAQHTHDATLALVMLHPNPSAALLKAVITHDFGEYRSGDMPYWAKKMNPILAHAIERMERDARQMYGVDFELELTIEESEWLTGVDTLSSWLFLFQNILCSNEMVRKDFNDVTRMLTADGMRPREICDAVRQILAMHSWVKTW